MKLRITQNKLLLYTQFFLLSVLVYFAMVSLSEATDFSDGLFRTLQSVVNFAIEIVGLVIIGINRKYMKRSYLNSAIFLWMLFVLGSCLFQADLRVPKNVIYTLFWGISYFYTFVIVSRDKIYEGLFRHFYVFIFIYSIILFMSLTGKNPFVFTQDSREQVNHIFFPLMTLPWLILIPKAKLKIATICILYLFVLLSFKRSAILAMSLALFYFVFAQLKSIGYSRKKRLILGVIALGVFFLILVIINYLADNFIYNRFVIWGLKSGGSGRTDIWLNVWELQKGSTLLEWVFGHGHNTVIKVNIYEGHYFSSHNDFLEVLYNYGFVVFFTFIALYLYLIKRFFYLKKIKSSLYIPFGVSIVLFGVFNLVSHLVLYPSYFAFLSSFWAYVEAITIRSKYNENNEK